MYDGASLWMLCRAAYLFAYCVFCTQNCQNKICTLYADICTQKNEIYTPYLQIRTRKHHSNIFYVFWRKHKGMDEQRRRLTKKVSCEINKSDLHDLPNVCSCQSLINSSGSLSRQSKLLMHPTSTKAIHGWSESSCQ